MRFLLAILVGSALGLLYFGGLWLSTQRLTRRPEKQPWVVLSRLGRLGLVVATFSALSQQGSAMVLAGLVGLWMARSYLIIRLGGNARDPQRDPP